MNFCNGFKHNKRHHVIISGRVQGVGFRAYTKNKADSLGLVGWVKNIMHGRVEAVYEGDEASVYAMTAWCQQGPSFARVEKLEMIEEPIFDIFSDSESFINTDNVAKSRKMRHNRRLSKIAPHGSTIIASLTVCTGKKSTSYCAPSPACR